MFQVHTALVPESSRTHTRLWSYWQLSIVSMFSARVPLQTARAKPGHYSSVHVALPQSSTLPSWARLFYECVVIHSVAKW